MISIAQIRKYEKIEKELEILQACELRMRKTTARLVREAINDKSGEPSYSKAFMYGFLYAATEAEWITTQERAEAVLAIDGQLGKPPQWWELD